MNFDPSALVSALFCLFVLALFVGASVMGYLLSQKRNAAWQELAACNGPCFESGGMLSRNRAYRATQTTCNSSSTCCRMWRIERKELGYSQLCSYVHNISRSKAR